jgi:parallel beta-helix repeat protein
MIKGKIIAITSISNANSTGYGEPNNDRNDNHLNIIKNNNIHNSRFGFYSVSASNILIENNVIHHNFMYGLDPHTGTVSASFHLISLPFDTSWGNQNRSGCIFVFLRCSRLRIDSSTLSRQ